jgi:hypothetical protein
MNWVERPHLLILCEHLVGRTNENRTTAFTAFLRAAHEMHPRPFEQGRTKGISPHVSEFVGCAQQTGYHPVILLVSQRLNISYVNYKTGFRISKMFLCTHRTFLLFIICINKCTHTHMYIHTKIPNYITDAATCFSTSAPSSGSFDIAFAEVINYELY